MATYIKIHSAVLLSDDILDPWIIDALNLDYDRQEDEPGEYYRYEYFYELDDEDEDNDSEVAYFQGNCQIIVEELIKKIGADKFLLTNMSGVDISMVVSPEVPF